MDHDRNYHTLAVKGCFNYDIVFYFPCDFENTEKEKNEHSWKERDGKKREKTDKIMTTLWKEFQEKENRSGSIQFVKLFGNEHDKVNIVTQEIKRLEERIHA